MPKSFWKIVVGSVVAIAAALVLYRVFDPPYEDGAGWKTVSYSPPADEERGRRELQLFEQILRERDYPPPRGEVIFVAFGSQGEANVDPPSNFLARLTDLDADFRPVSDAEYYESRRSNRTGGVWSKSDGRKGHVYYVQIIEWQADDRVRVDHGLYGGPLYGGGVRNVTYEYVDGRWTVAADGQHFIS